MKQIIKKPIMILDSLEQKYSVEYQKYMIKKIYPDVITAEEIQQGALESDE